MSEGQLRRQHSFFRNPKSEIRTLERVAMGVRWAVLAGWIALIFGMSSIPSLHFGFGPVWEQVARKFTHVVLYGVLTVLLWVSTDISNKTRRLGLCVIIALMLAAGDEFHQVYVVGRHGNLVGVLFDLVGILAAAFWIKAATGSESQD